MRFKRSNNVGGLGTMQCDSCTGAMTKRVTTQKDPYIYTLSGLKNVRLIGIEVWECQSCEADSPVIPKIAELHHLIARNLVSKRSRLSGPEIRFLRKNAEFSAKDFSALLKIDPSTLSRAENSTTPILGETAEKLARAISILVRSDECAREVLLDLASHLKQGRPTFFELKQNRWEPRRVA